MLPFTQVYPFCHLILKVEVKVKSVENIRQDSFELVNVKKSICHELGHFTKASLEPKRKPFEK